MAFLGIDLGTSGLRALLTDAQGNPVAAAERPLRTSRPQPGWAEQNPQHWIDALERAVSELAAAQPEFRSLRGIGIAGHMHGATLIGADGKVIRPCILWNDMRSHREAAQLDALPGVRDVSGSIVFPGFTAPKLLWLRGHEPENFSRAAKVLLPASFLSFYLTGEIAADMSDAAGTSWLDTGGRDWSDRLLEASQMRRSQMPCLTEGTAAAGRLRPGLARKWGLRGAVAVTAGAGDNAAAACGIGALKEGQGFLSLGTSGVLLMARGGYHPAPDTALHTFCHAVPDRWYQMGVMLSATGSLNWLAQISGRKAADLTAELGGTLAAPGKVRFLPYLSGERTPHNDAVVRGAFTGLDAATGPAELTRAVLEGVAYSMRDSAEALESAGAQMTRLFAVGGGAASDYWLRLLATVLGVPLCRPENGESGAALGAARLAICAAEGASPETVMHQPDRFETFDPEPDQIKDFAAGYKKFKAAYPAIRAVQ